MMFLKDGIVNPKPEKDIKIAKSDNLFDNWSQASESITKNWVEVTTIMKINDQCDCQC